MKYILLYLIPVLLQAPAAWAQNTTSSLNAGWQKTDDTREDEDDLPLYHGWRQQNQSSLILANINERMRVSPNPLNSGKGLGFEVGLNIGYLFNQRLLLGAFGGWAMRDVFYTTKFTASYRSDFNNAYHTTGYHGNDSLVVNEFSTLINNGNFHDQEIYYGIVFRLPYKWAPLVKLYTGQFNWVYKTFDHLPVTPSSDTRNDNDYYNISYKLAWGAEVVLFHGYTKIFEYNDELPFPRKGHYFFNNGILPISFFVERINSTHSEFSWEDGQIGVKIPASQLLSPAFMQQYKANFYYGFRISYGLF